MSGHKVTQKAQRLRAGASNLEQQLRAAPPQLPDSLKGEWKASDKAPVPADKDFVDKIKALFPSTCEVPTCSVNSSGAPITASNLKVAVVLSGGQAPGGHNVVAGLYDAVKRTGPASEFYGFCDGPHGIFSGNVVRIDDAMIDGYRNTGGFDMIGSGRHKIEDPEQFAASMATAQQLGLDGLVVVGGDDSNTNAALLAEYFQAKGSTTKVVGCPKTIDGDLKCPPEIPVSFGFDTACRTYSELVSNVEVDALSSQKYYHFCRLMGRSASNIAIEVALLTRPNICLLGEEVQTKNMSLSEITQQLVSMITKRAQDGKNYGVVLLPEGLVEFIPEFNTMIAEINDLGDGLKEAEVITKLSPKNSATFQYLPPFIRAQLLLDRDPHGNVQVSKIETEKLLASCVEQELEKLRASGEFKGSFSAQFHAFGYEGRAALPSLFDATYCYVLGYTAGVLLAAGRTGLIASVKNLLKPVAEWECGGVPVTSLCVIERRKGKDKPVIKKALVELDGPLSQPFQVWSGIRDRLQLEDHYRCSGPLQFDLACPTSLELPISLQLELGGSYAALDAGKPDGKLFGSILFGPRALSSRSQLQQWRSETAPKTPSAFDVSKVSMYKVGATQPPLKTDSDSIRKALPSTFQQPLVEIRPEADGPPVKSTSQFQFSPEPRKWLGDEEEVSIGTNAKVGVAFLGRQAPGGHEVLFGMAEALKCRGGEVFGFVGGSEGLVAGHAVNIGKETEQYRRTGGFELLGRTKDSLKAKDYPAVVASCKKFGLTGLVLIGGTRTATDAALLAEHCAAEKSGISIVLVPCGIENSLTNPFVEMSLGFDSAAKTVAQLVANTCTDGASARKYYYFLRLMGGSSTGMEATSHLTMEIGLSVRPNIVIIGEEVAERRMTLKEIVEQIANTVCERAADGKNFGTIVFPEGLLACIPETRVLVGELATCKGTSVDEVVPQLSSFSSALFKSFPSYIQNDLLKERQSDGVVDLTQVHVGQLFADLVEAELKSRKEAGKYKGSFSAVTQFLGYQARTSMPSNFDSEYGRSLGNTAALLAATGCNGYFASVSGLAGPVESWRCSGAPISAICTATDEGVRVKPMPVQLHGSAWEHWCKMRSRCASEDLYRNPGPIQLSGADSDRVCETLKHAASHWGSVKNYLEAIDELHSKVDMLVRACRPGCEASFARVAVKTLGSVEEILQLMREG